MTAIEFLVEELKKRSIDLTLWHKDLVEQGKEMEKQQIIDAFDDGYSDGFRDNGKFGSEYYNEIFKNK